MACPDNKNIDNIFVEFDNQATEIVNLLYTNPQELINRLWWTGNSILSIDQECLCKMGTGEIRTKFACRNCNIIGRLVDFRMGGLETPFVIECGCNVGKTMIISSYPIYSSGNRGPSLHWDEAAAMRSKLYLQKFDLVGICGTPNTYQVKCLAGDPFTIKTCLTFLVQNLFASKQIPHAPRLKSAHICGQYGYSLYEMAGIGPYSEFRMTGLTADKVRALFLQLTAILITLQEINFSHGTPSAGALVFDNQPCAYEYDGIQIISDHFTLLISDFWQSTATLENLHIFNSSEESETYIGNSAFVPEIQRLEIPATDCAVTKVEKGYQIKTSSTSHGGSIKPGFTVAIGSPSDNSQVCQAISETITVFRMNSENFNILNYLRHGGFAIYSGAFDMYCFMVSLMLDEELFNVVVNDLDLYQIWARLWLADEILAVEAKLRTAHSNFKQFATDTASTAAAVDILRGFNLRCDIIYWLWSGFKK